MAARVRKIETIWRNLQKFLNPANPAKVRTKHAVTKYLNGPAATQAALIVTLNKYPPFKRDDVSLRPNDVPPNATVGQLLIALVVEYENNGWDVK